ncbi:MAG: hypothetical protein KKC68_05900, partial [Candidatus Thermoplasmatota archaeon]|nr:hypothetical protein [Candidatus Thermoplasmatota archaeon]
MIKKRKIVMLIIFYLTIFFLITSSLSTGKIMNKKDGENEVKLFDTNCEKPKLFDDTILDGSKKVMVNNNGRIMKGMDREYFDYIISFEDYYEICEYAYKKYYQRYGIDLRSNNEDHYVNLIDFLKIPFTVPKDTLSNTIPVSGPHQKNGHMTVEWFIACDEKHEPDNPDKLLRSCIKGWQRFGEFGIDTCSAWYFGIWDASNVGFDYTEILYDFKQEWISWNWPHDYSFIEIGLVDKSNHNGAAYLNDCFGFVAENVNWFSINHAKDRIAQHELTHCIGGIPDDPGWWPWDHNWKSCIINYFYLWIGATNWCNDCWNILNSKI